MVSGPKYAVEGGKNIPEAKSWELPKRYSAFSVVIYCGGSAPLVGRAVCDDSRRDMASLIRMYWQFEKYEAQYIGL